MAKRLARQRGTAHPKKERIVRHYLKQWRKRRGLTQDQLAERVERTRGLIAQYESGQTEMPESMIYALAHALAIDTWDLFKTNPEKEGELVDITDELRGLDEKERSEALGYIRAMKARKAS